ncbi:hypothetical protein L0244_16745 [bacterium]|nr:hypothetical protein [bacterium]
MIRLVLLHPHIVGGIIIILCIVAAPNLVMNHSNGLRQFLIDFGGGGKGNVIKPEGSVLLTGLLWA